MTKNKLDYRHSHTEKGKGKVYHQSFEIHNYRKSIWDWEQKVLGNILQKKLNSNSTILDFACGTGRILKFLSSLSDNVTGVDVSDSMLEVTRKNIPDVEIIQADITVDNVLIKDRKFDVITAFRFFLNAQNPLRIEVLNALHPLLKKDGIFILNNHGNALGIGTFLGKWAISAKNKFRKSDEAFTYNILSEGKLKKLLHESGYTITGTYHRNVFPILNEKTKFDFSKVTKLEDWFSSRKFFRPFARNIIYVCQKK